MAAAQLFLNEIRQLVAGDGIGDNGTVRGLLRRDGRRQRDKPVAAQLGAIGFHRARPVYIGIKDKPQVTAARQYRPAEVLHRFLVFGVRHMVGEAAVRLQVHARGNIRAQRRQHPRGIEAARAVAGIHRYFQSSQRPLAAIHPGDDALPQHGGIGGQDIKRGEPPMQPGRFRARLRPTQQLLNIGGFQPALPGKELQSVAVLRQVARGDHHRPIKIAARQHRRHKHSRGAGHAAIGRHGPHGHQSGQYGPLQAGPGKTAISSHGDPQLLRRFTAALHQPCGKGPADLSGGFLGQVYRLRRYQRQRHPPDITSVLQLTVLYHSHYLLFCVPLILHTGG